MTNPVAWLLNHWTYRERILRTCARHGHRTVLMTPQRPEINGTRQFIMCNRCGKTLRYLDPPHSKETPK